MNTALQITLAEFDRMIRRGVFVRPRNRRIELIRGALRQMSPPGPTHEAAVDKLTRWSIEHTDGDEVCVRVQNSIGLPELNSAPQPDIAWVRTGAYEKKRPESEDVLLVIEVSNSSLNYDKGKKARLYAEAGVADYWVVNLRDACLEVFRDPQDGEYGSQVIIDRYGRVSPLAFPKLKLALTQLFDWYET